MDKPIIVNNNQEKLQQYNEFFGIDYDFTLNIMPLNHDDVITYEHFIEKMPMPFKLASNMVTLDQAALRPIKASNNVTSQLVDFLNHQAKKIDLLIGYILSQQDEVQYRYQGIKFGGGGVKFIAKTPFELGQQLEIKLFLLDDNCAVYCYGEVIAVSKKTELSAQGDFQFQHKVIFHFIREDDRDVLVRASLHEQSKQLQKLSQLRNQQGDD